jgi:hypothetical protein
VIFFSAKATIGTSPAATSPAAASPTVPSRSPARRRRLGAARGWRTKGRGDEAPGARMRQVSEMTNQGFYHEKWRFYQEKWRFYQEKWQFYCETNEK